MNEQTVIQIIVNGEPVSLATGSNVTHLVTQLELAPERLAVELNLSIVPRARWAETELRSGDKLEVVHFVGGG